MELRKTEEEIMKGKRKKKSRCEEW